MLSLLSACVDVLSSEGHLNAMSAMEISQMVVQAMWGRDSPPKQIPHFEGTVIDSCNKAGIKDVFEFMEAMDPNENPNYGKLVQSMGLSNNQLGDAARFTNERYPNVELNFELEDSDNIASNTPALVNVSIEREFEDDEEPVLAVHAPFYPAEKTENWWPVVGEESSKNLLAIKRVTIGRSLKTKLEIVLPTPGKHGTHAVFDE